MGDLQLAEQLRQRGVNDQRVLDAIAALDRADFLPSSAREHATGDYAYPIGHGQTISQPFVVGFMTQALGLHGNERVLEIGTGSGYQTAVLAQLCRELYSIEIVAPLAAQARAVLERLKLPAELHLRVGDGNAGWPEAAPFDAIILTAAPEKLPQTLVSQLRPGGRLLAPIGGETDNQDLILVEKDDQGGLAFQRLLPVRFVPMIGGTGAPSA